jgi:glucosamine 6-phosphate synthetase-like amidotransferase/phosphosugar isomerase protein
MCGIFGFLSTDGRGPELARLRRIAAETETRGRHAFGLVWIDAHGQLHAFKRPGAASDDLDDLELCRGCQAMIGHCRWATRGDPQENRNNHPHFAGRGWLVHNGVVRNYDALVRRYRFRLRSDCDSEVFCHLMMQSGGSILQRACWAVRQAEGSLAILGLWANPLRMLVVRRGRPLAVATTRRGHYFASLPRELPASPRPVNDNFAAVYFSQSGLLRQQCVSLPPETALC